MKIYNNLITSFYTHLVCKIYFPGDKRQNLAVKITIFFNNILNNLLSPHLLPERVILQRTFTSWSELGNVAISAAKHFFVPKKTFKHQKLKFAMPAGKTKNLSLTDITRKHRREQIFLIDRWRETRFTC